MILYKWKDKNRANKLLREKKNSWVNKSGLNELLLSLADVTQLQPGDAEGISSHLTSYLLLRLAAESWGSHSNNNWKWYWICSRQNLFKTQVLRSVLQICCIPHLLLRDLWRWRMPVYLSFIDDSSDESDDKCEGSKLYKTRARTKKPIINLLIRWTNSYCTLVQLWFCSWNKL